MTRVAVLRHKFVEFIPDEVAEGTIYVSIPYATAVHKCCCGCGNLVVTPITPTDWQLTFDGESVSLHPSIGNWSFDCQSHYWIRRNRVQWAPRWSREEIETGRAQDRLAKQGRAAEPTSPPLGAPPSDRGPATTEAPGGFWRRLMNWLGR